MNNMQNVHKNRLFRLRCVQLLFVWPVNDISKTQIFHAKHPARNRMVFKCKTLQKLSLGNKDRISCVGILGGKNYWLFFKKSSKICWGEWNQLSGSNAVVQYGLRYMEYTLFIWESPLSPESLLESGTCVCTKHKSSSSEVYVLSYNF